MHSGYLNSSENDHLQTSYAPDILSRTHDIRNDAIPTSSFIVKGCSKHFRLKQFPNSFNKKHGRLSFLFIFKPRTTWEVIHIWKRTDTVHHITFAKCLDFQTTLIGVNDRCYALCTSYLSVQHTAVWCIWAVIITTLLQSFTCLSEICNHANHKVWANFKNK